MDKIERQNRECVLCVPSRDQNKKQMYWHQVRHKKRIDTKSALKRKWQLKDVSKEERPKQGIHHNKSGESKDGGS